MILKKPDCSVCKEEEKGVVMVRVVRTPVDGDKLKDSVSVAEGMFVCGNCYLKLEKNGSNGIIVES